MRRIAGTIKDIQNIAISHGIPIEYERRKKKEGWMGKPKGMLQVLFERGHIDTSIENVVRHYSVNGRKDAMGNTIAGTSLKSIIEDLPDFKEELTLLQHRAIQLGVRIETSPKYHPEIAGETIEYCWGCSKNTYRQYPLESKKKKRQF